MSESTDRPWSSSQSINPLKTEQSNHPPSIQSTSEDNPRTQTLKFIQNTAPAVVEIWAR